MEGQSPLLYAQARHYDPRWGRFLQREPLGIAADQLYAYAANNPYRFHDPTGLSPESINDPSLLAGLLGLTKGAGVGLVAYVVCSANPACVAIAGAVGGAVLLHDYFQDFSGLYGFVSSVVDVFRGRSTYEGAFWPGVGLGTAGADITEAVAARVAASGSRLQLLRGPHRRPPRLPRERQ